MTKVTILGQGEVKQPEKKKIEFVKWVNPNGKEIKGAAHRPSHFRFIELVCASNGDEALDVMFAYDSNRNNGNLYLGHFNDGVV